MERDISPSDTPWTKYFVQKVNDFEGYVLDDKTLTFLQREYEDKLGLSLLTRSTYKVKDLEDAIKSSKRYFFVEPPQKNGPTIPFDGIPFVVAGRTIKECEYGQNHKRSASQNKEKQSRIEHAYSASCSRKRIRNTKKKGCTAIMTIREILKLNKVQIGENSPYRKRVGKQMVKETIEENSNFGLSHLERQIWIKLPQIQDHKDHLIGQTASYVQKIDSRLKTKMTDLMEAGVVKTAEMKRHLKVYVEQDLFSGQVPPKKSTRAYYPGNTDIYNHMAYKTRQSRHSPNDQLNLKHYVENVKKDSEDEIFYRSHRNESTQPSGEEDLILVYQSNWQKEILKRYGNDICLMDSTYKTSKYDIPCFAISVPANIGYLPVGFFVVEHERTESIKEALEIMKGWNTGWNPSNFMTDFDEREIQAIERTFRDTEVLLCDFHRMQSWDRWLNKEKNGCRSHKQEITTMLKKVAAAKTQEEYNRAEEEMKSSTLWQQSERLRQWIERKWLPHSKRWVKAYRNSRLNNRVNTTNGLERQHRHLKEQYLKNLSDNTLTGLVKVIIEDFTPDCQKRYELNNIRSSNLFKNYSQEIPTFLYNRPDYFIQHCMKRLKHDIQIEDIHQTADRDFFVNSEKSERHYRVNLGGEMPFCECGDWVENHLPCKHLLAVLMLTECTWESLPIAYKTCPTFQLDMGLIVPSEYEGEEAAPSNEGINVAGENVPMDRHVKEKPEEAAPSNEDINVAGENVPMDRHAKEKPEEAAPSNEDINVAGENVPMDRHAKEKPEEAAPSNEDINVAGENVPMDRHAKEKPEEAAPSNEDINVAGENVHMDLLAKPMDAKACREILSELTRLTYIVEDIRSLSNLGHKLERLYSDFKQNTNKESGLEKLEARKKKRNVDREKISVWKIIGKNLQEPVGNGLTVMDLKRLDGEPSYSEICLLDAECKKMGIPGWMSGWLNDNIVNTFIQSLVDSSDGFLLINSLAFQQISNSQKKKAKSVPCKRPVVVIEENAAEHVIEEMCIFPEKDLKILSKVKLNKMSKIFVPVCSSHHWTLTVLDMDKKVFRQYDPMTGIGNEKIIQILQLFFKNRMPLDHLREEITQYPLQEDSSSCGAMICFYAMQECKEPGQMEQRVSSDELRIQIANSLLVCKSSSQKPESTYSSSRTDTSSSGDEDLVPAFTTQSSSLTSQNKSANSSVWIPWKNSIDTALTAVKYCGSKTVNYLMAIRNKHKIWFQDIKDLVTGNTLSEQVIDAYLELIIKRQNSKKILHIETYTLTQLIENGSKACISTLKEDIDDYDLLIGIYNENRNHWSLIIINPHVNTVIYLNPMGETSECQQAVLGGWRAYMRKRLLASVSCGNKKMKWTIENMDHPKQEDAVSCGVLALQFAECLVLDTEMDFGTGNVETSFKRDLIAKELLNNSDPVNNYCRHCGVHYKNSEIQDWVKCDYCETNGWFHYSHSDPFQKGIPFQNMKWQSTEFKCVWCSLRMNSATNDESLIDKPDPPMFTSTPMKSDDKLPDIDELPDIAIPTKSPENTSKRTTEASNAKHLQQQAQLNPIVLVTKTKQVRRCFGCECLFSPDYNLHPKNLVLRNKGPRQFYKEGKLITTYQNRYFHARYHCIKVHFPHFNVNHLVVGPNLRISAEQQLFLASEGLIIDDIMNQSFS